MHHYRQVLVPLRQGETYREIACSRLKAAAAVRALSKQAGWLDPATPLPEDGVSGVTIHAALCRELNGPNRRRNELQHQSFDSGNSV